jgi:hypothetical protein
VSRVRNPLTFSGRCAATAVILAALLAGCSHGGGSGKKHAGGPPAGGRSPAYEKIVTGEGRSANASATNDPILFTAQSSGTPGLVLTRAMDGAQALGYTLITVDDQSLYFVAEKHVSILASMLGSRTGGCKIAVGTEKDPDTKATKVTLKGVSATAAARPSCKKDLDKVLEYARGEAIVKPKKPSQILRPGVYERGEP